MKQNQIILAILLFVFLLDIQSIFGDNNPGRPSVGVVLSGGGARGIAHIGVLRELEKYHIPIDYIGGTSFGALIAAFYASGYNSYQIEKIIKNINWDVVLSTTQSRQQYYFYTRKSEEENLLKVRFKNWSLQIPGSISSSQKILSILTYYFTRPNYISNGNFLKLEIPLFISTTDIVSGKNKIFISGNLIKAIQASMSVPFLLSPVKIDTSLFVDGGITNNLPISAMKEMGAEIIIASDATNFLHSRKKMTSPITVADQIINIMMQSKIENELKQADVILRPSLENISNTEFKRWADMIALGEVEAKSKKEEILSLISPKLDSLPASQLARYSKPKKIVFIGNTVFKSDDILSTFQPELGMAQSQSPPQISANIDKIKKTIIKKYTDNGYILAYIDSVVVQDNKATFYINEGKIEKISVSGNNLTKNYVIRREISTKISDVFNISRVQSDVERIYSTNYFELVDFSVKKTASRNVALDFIVKEKPFGVIEAGANYNTEESSSAFISVGHENIFGTGNALDFYMRFGTERKCGIHLISDRIGRTNLNNSLELFIRENMENKSDRDWNLITETGFFDDRRLGLFSFIFDYRISNLKAQKRTSGLGVKLIFDNFDKFPYPDKGLYRMASYTNFNKNIGSDYGFHQVKLINGMYTNFLHRITLSNWINMVINSTEKDEVPYIRKIKKRPDNTFFGFHNDEVFGEDIFYTSLQMRILLKEFSMRDPRQQLFLVTKGGIGKFGNIDSMEEFWDIFKKGSKFGYAVGLEIPTIFGPVILMYENSKDNSFWNFSVGYNF